MAGDRFVVLCKLFLIATGSKVSLCFTGQVKVVRALYRYDAQQVRIFDDLLFLFMLYFCYLALLLRVLEISVRCQGCYQIGNQVFD